MKQFFKRLTLNAINFYGVLALFIFVLFFTLLVIFEEYKAFKEESQNLREAYFITQKEKAQEETQKVLEYMHFFYEKMYTQMGEAQLQKSIVSSIEKLFDRKNGSSYLFIYTVNGVNVSDPNKPYNRGKNLIGFQDANGKYVIKELIEKAKVGGGYVSYMWDNPLTKQPSTKVSYAHLFKPWNWMIGTGVYLDEIDKIIEENRIKHRNRLFKYIMEILALAGLLFSIAYLVIRFISKTIKSEMESLKVYFKNAATHNVFIDEGEIRIKELQTLVAYANEMVAAIHDKNEKLQELNTSLEDKVVEKTSKLQEQIIYNKRLLVEQDSFIRHSIHEINTPLAVILTNIELYKMKYSDNPYHSKMEAATKMIANIYDDLGYMIKRDRIVYVKSVLNFADFLRARIDFFEEIAKGNGYSIRLKADETIELYFNDIELQRIIDNNLSNAIKYAKKETEVSVTLFTQKQKVVLEFVTHSKQIEDREKIFKAFYREQEQEGGFGLGLEIVGSICQKEGVTIEVESNERFTTFRYLFSVKKREDKQ
jgi:signal transduction histidine kinase